MTYKGIDTTNEDAIKIAIDVWDDVVNNKLYVKREDCDSLVNQAIGEGKVLLAAQIDKYEKLWDLILNFTPALEVTRYDVGKLQIYFEKYTVVNDKLLEAQKTQETMQNDFNAKIAEKENEILKLKEQMGMYIIQVDNLSKDLKAMKVQKEVISKFEAVISSISASLSKLRLPLHKKVIEPKTEIKRAYKRVKPVKQMKKVRKVKSSRKK